MASKLDHLAAEYSQLLVSQLDQQRAYYDGLLQRVSEVPMLLFPSTVRQSDSDKLRCIPRHLSCILGFVSCFSCNLLCGIQQNLLHASPCTSHIL